MAERRTSDPSGLHGAHGSGSRLEHSDKILRRLGSGEKANSIRRRLGQTRGLEPDLRRSKGGDLSDEGYDAGILNRFACINSGEREGRRYRPRWSLRLITANSRSMAKPSRRTRTFDPGLSDQFTGTSAMRYPRCWARYSNSRSKPNPSIEA